ncbi:hypothetical protein KEM55_009215, partial [Ascosphaera atra]
MPVYDSSHDDVVWEGRRGDAYGEGTRTSRTPRGGGFDDDDDYSFSDRGGARSRRANTWQDDVYDRPYDDFDNYGSISRSATSRTGGNLGRSTSARMSRANPNETFDNYETDLYAPPSAFNRSGGGGGGGSVYDGPGRYQARSRASTFTGIDDDYVYTDRPRRGGPPPGRPNAPKPDFYGGAP